MPKWGLNPTQRRTMPWGIPAEQLEPGKVITDPVHGDIYLTRLEQRVVDGAPFQRLRRVKQLGTTHLVYPGATHSRFSHSLGALRMAQDLFDAVMDQRDGPKPVRDIFEEWETDPKNYDRKVAEATVLIRLGALLHDLCHVPFGHSVEDDIGILTPHDANLARFESLWHQFPADLQDQLSGDLLQELRGLILSKEESAKDPKGSTIASADRYPFAADIVGNTICADLLDYLPRDHMFTGLPAQLGHRFISGFYVTPTDHAYAPSHMVMRITRDQRQRADVVSELFKFLRYRYELSERVLVHHAKLAADAMVGKMLEMWSDAKWVDKACQLRPRTVKETGKDISLLRKEISTENAKLKSQIDDAVKTELEKDFTSHGDDGLLEHILGLYGPEEEDRRKRAIASLTHDILHRRLYKPIGRSTGALARARDISKVHGTPEGRRKLEEDVARYAGLDQKWHVVLWIPAPSMRLKAAQVLVDDGTVIAELKDLPVGKMRGKDIYDSHEALWAIDVFAHASVAAQREKVDVILARLSELLGGIAWDLSSAQPSATVIAAGEVSKKRNHRRLEQDALLVELKTREIPAAAAATFESLTRYVEGVAQELHSTKQMSLAEQPLSLEDFSEVLKEKDASLAPEDLEQWYEALLRFREDLGLDWQDIRTRIARFAASLSAPIPNPDFFHDAERTPTARRKRMTPDDWKKI